MLYPSAEAGDFMLGIERLARGGKYRIEEGATYVADSEGVLNLNVHVDGRTVVKLVPVEV